MSIFFFLIFKSASSKISLKLFVCSAIVQKDSNQNSRVWVQSFLVPHNPFMFIMARSIWIVKCWREASESPVVIQNILKLAVESCNYIQLLCFMNYVEWIWIWIMLNVLRCMEVRLTYTDFPFVTISYRCRNRGTLKRCVLWACIVFYALLV